VAHAFVLVVCHLRTIFQRDRDRYDFPVEGAFFYCCGCAPVALQRELVQFLTGESVFFGHHFCAAKLRKAVQTKSLFGGGTQRILPLIEQHSAEHRCARHALDTGSDNNVLGARHNGLGCELNGLLGGTALPVDGYGRHADRKF